MRDGKERGTVSKNWKKMRDRKERITKIFRTLTRNTVKNEMRQEGERTISKTNTKNGGKGRK